MGVEKCYFIINGCIHGWPDTWSPLRGRSPSVEVWYKTDLYNTNYNLLVCPNQDIFGNHFISHDLDIKPFSNFISAISKTRSSSSIILYTSVTYKCINLRKNIHTDMLTQIRHLEVHTPTLRARSIFARVENYWPRIHFIIYIFSSWPAHAKDHNFRIPNLGKLSVQKWRGCMFIRKAILLSEY